jgi:D-beta-D-heptose 7-phosphate kinase/D-beta-D-heptose 1-phosphate adenosyltransferase
MKQKIISYSKIQGLARALKRRRKTIVFTNGTFDLLHLGHITYLQKAKQLGDILIVGVNTDRSVKTYKSSDRPLNSEADRIRVLTALEAVDYAVLFDDPTPRDLILKIRPDILVKGADWKKSEIAGAKEVESWGGRVVRIRMLSGRSTTRLIEKIKRLSPLTLPSPPVGGED